MLTLTLNGLGEYDRYLYSPSKRQEHGCVYGRTNGGGCLEARSFTKAGSLSVPTPFFLLLNRFEAALCARAGYFSIETLYKRSGSLRSTGHPQSNSRLRQG